MTDDAEETCDITNHEFTNIKKISRASFLREETQICSSHQSHLKKYPQHHSYPTVNPEGLLNHQPISGNGSHIVNEIRKVSASKSKKYETDNPKVSERKQSYFKDESHIGFSSPTQSDKYQQQHSHPIVIPIGLRKSELASRNYCAGVGNMKKNSFYAKDNNRTHETSSFSNTKQKVKVNKIEICFRDSRKINEIKSTSSMQHKEKKKEILSKSKRSSRKKVLQSSQQIYSLHHTDATRNTREPYLTTSFVENNERESSKTTHLSRTAKERHSQNVSQKNILRKTAWVDENQSRRYQFKYHCDKPRLKESENTRWNSYNENKPPNIPISEVKYYKPFKENAHEFFKNQGTGLLDHKLEERLRQINQTSTSSEAKLNNLLERLRLKTMEKCSRSAKDIELETHQRQKM